MLPQPQPRRSRRSAEELKDEIGVNYPEPFLVRSQEFENLAGSPQENLGFAMEPASGTTSAGSECATGSISSPGLSDNVFEASPPVEWQHPVDRDDGASPTFSPMVELQPPPSTPGTVSLTPTPSAHSPIPRIEITPEPEAALYAADEPIVEGADEDITEQEEIDVAQTPTLEHQESSNGSDVERELADTALRRATESLELEDRELEDSNEGVITDEVARKDSTGEQFVQGERLEN